MSFDIHSSFFLKNGRLYSIGIEGKKVIVRSQEFNSQESSEVFIFDRVSETKMPKTREQAYLEGYSKGIRDGAVIAEDSMWELINVGLMFIQQVDMENTRSLQ